jgi:hypothetical protein
MGRRLVPLMSNVDAAKLLLTEIADLVLKLSSNIHAIATRLNASF